ncbi:pyridoxal phosphate-dependent decarboxylase family protein [Aestuariirhabdus litorea]|uniref:Pyridoxal-dependent decarboxylase n=1 Tax=Aestuariirhabdus litorea TaxID=2528527 RepID=A0A3P3VRC5_9GAMM|nr:pyridoxal-dependent decarboxylase [Aestuariirhabdus litorea]RRJ85180.1 pyridoxal-dependent decarboxylase [Aestuariirhabdus litorea]RWW98402.1 pyridoxal-dependent decarboxylase [Endozoicomonadaceae bacterium GTF-13]
MDRELAETGHLQALLSQLGAALDNYLNFTHPDALQSGVDWKRQLDRPLPERGEGIEAVNRALIDTLVAHASAIPNPGFSGYITTGGVTASTLALTAASVSSPQRYMLTAFNFVEELSLEWLSQMLGIGHLKGVYSSGGSVANLVALGGARQQAFEGIGIDPASEGMTGRGGQRPACLYASDQCHHTIQRAAGVLGLGRRSVRIIPSDGSGRMRVEALERALAEDRAEGRLPVAIVANAGTTNTGAIDPLRAMGELARAQGVWFHVDGAYGLPGILDPRKSVLYDGLELADSVIVDPHKWLGASVGVAATFVRDRDILMRAFTQEPADYLEGSMQRDEPERFDHSLDSFGIPYFDFGVELSAPCRGVVVWSMIREIGVEGFRQRIVRHNDMALELAEIARAHPQLELLLEPTLSICCFRFVDERIDDLNAFNQMLLRQLVRENRFMPTSTRVGEALAIRPCYIGARHAPEQVAGLVDEVVRLGNLLLQAGDSG